MTEYPLEIDADEVVKEFRSFINNEEKFILKEHELKDVFLATSTVLAHLGDLFPPSHLLLHVYHTIHDTVAQLLEILNTGALKNLKLVREEEKNIKDLKTKISHFQWKAVKNDVESEIELETKAIRLEMEELMSLHREFEHIIEFLDMSLLKPYLENRHLREHLPKKSHRHQATYYFIHLYKMFKSYEQIFRDLIKKERTIKASAESKVHRLLMKIFGIGD